MNAATLKKLEEVRQRLEEASGPMLTFSIILKDMAKKLDSHESAKAYGAVQQLAMGGNSMAKALLKKWGKELMPVVQMRSIATIADELQRLAFAASPKGS